MILIAGEIKYIFIDTLILSIKGHSTNLWNYLIFIDLETYKMTDISIFL